FAIVLECIPSELAKTITQKVSVPTIGIGAGPFCDGQILVIDDLLGLTRGPVPKFVKRYAELGQASIKAVQEFRKEIKDKLYPQNSPASDSPSHEKISKKT